MPRIGVFVCWCGTNIAKTVDVKRAAEAASKMPGVVYATDYQYMCSDPGQKMILDAIRDHRLDRVVVASCSPALHELTFQNCVESGGLNRYMFEMANIREQCSWVHENVEEATAKAIDIIWRAVAKVSRLEPLFRSEIPITKKALVIGGGIAGIQAALDIAEAGYEVTVVERTPSIGGRMAQFDKTFPTLDCAACILTPKMVEVAQHPNIRLFTYSEVEEVSGYVGNFEVTIRKKARSVDMEKCTGCGECWSKCPRRVPSEFDAFLGRRKAIYVPFPQAVPLVPVIDRENCRWFTEQKCQVCQRVCPAGAVDYEQQDELIVDKFGAIVVATGIDLLDQKAYGEYGAGEFKDVISGEQFERLVNFSGPTEGKIVRPSDGKEPKTVVFVQCVGSRDENKGYPYCSKVCCMYTAKHALLLKEHIPEAQVFVFYIDIRASGKGYEEFIWRVQEEFGVRYLRGKVSKIFPKNEKLIVRGADTLLGKQIEIEADLVVLATALTPRHDAKELARKLNISTDAYGFFTEAHAKLRPTETLTAGIFLAGACHFAKDIPDSVASGSAAAAKVCDLLSQDYLLSEPMIAEVNPERCVNCQACIEVCPFNAIEAVAITDRLTRKERTVAKVNEGLCQGCGACVAACRPKAIDLKGFKERQILAELEALARV